LGRAVALEGSGEGIKQYVGIWDMSVLTERGDVWSTGGCKFSPDPEYVVRLNTDIFLLSCSCEPDLLLVIRDIWNHACLRIWYVARF
jgi:hypothetical protein